MVAINDQTFHVNGKPHQIITTKFPLTYAVVEIQEVPENWKSWATGLVRVKLHIGDLKSCLEFLLKLEEEK